MMRTEEESAAPQKRTPRINIGIDPGLSGGIAVLEEEEFRAVYPMPVEAKASGRRQVDCYGLCEIAREVEERFFSESNRALILIEKVSAMPKQGVAGMFSLGDSFGCVRMFSSMLRRARVEQVSAAAWKRTMGLIKKDKKYSLALARRRFPTARSQLALAKHEGLAEALLLAHYAHMIL